MKTFTAKQLHDNPSEVYRAAVREPVKVTHKHHGDFVLVEPSMLRGSVKVYLPGDIHDIEVNGTISYD